MLRLTRSKTNAPRGRRCVQTLKVISLLGGGEEEGRRERSLLSGFLGRELVKQTVHHL
jgi:hypothetical protein